MKKIGMIVAVEIQSVLDKFGGKLTRREDIKAFQVLECALENCHLIIVNSGVGEIAASAAAQFLISAFGVDMIVNFGVVGGLTPEMKKTKVCIVEKVVHYEIDTAAIDDIEVGRYLEYPDVYLPATAELVAKAVAKNPELKPVICASGDKFIAEPERKRELNRLYGADICEMEAAGIVLTCNRNAVPCMLIKIVSDSIEGGGEEYLATKDTAASLCLEIILDLL